MCILVLLILDPTVSRMHDVDLPLCVMYVALCFSLRKYELAFMTHLHVADFVFDVLMQ